MLDADTDDDDDAVQASTQCDAVQASTQEEAPTPADEEEEAVTAAPWGRLLAMSDSAIRLVLQGDEPFSVGRSSASSLRLDDPRVSSVHARITNDADRGPSIVDESTNGVVWLNGEKLEKGVRRPLKHLDELAFAGASASTSSVASTSFLFTVPAATATAMVAAAARAMGAADAALAAPAASAGGGASSSAASGSSADVEKNLLCSICQGIMYRPVAVQPCLHAFCGGCFCEWLRRKPDCPQCRQPVRLVSRNHAIGNIIDGFLAQHPEKARDAEELKRLDAEDTLGNEPKAVRKRERGEGAEAFDYSASDDGSGSDDDSGDEVQFNKFKCHCPRCKKALMFYLPFAQFDLKRVMTKCPQCGTKFIATYNTTVTTVTMPAPAPPAPALPAPAPPAPAPAPAPAAAPPAPDLKDLG